MKGIDNILKPLYDLWHKVMDKLSVKNNVLLIDGKEIAVKMIVENIKQLSDSQCDELQCGDIVAKKTVNMFHLYQVTYKEDKHGICLTYQAAGLQETQSYDYVEGHWVYNSEDVVNTGGHTDAEVKALAVDAVEEATSGTVADVIGLDSQGHMVKGAVSGGGGTKLYRHAFGMSINGTYYAVQIISNKSTAYANPRDAFDDAKAVERKLGTGSAWATVLAYVSTKVYFYDTTSIVNRTVPSTEIDTDTITEL